MNDQKVYPPARSPPRARQARLNTQQHPLLQPLHSQRHTQQHPLLQPLDLWLGVRALLACPIPRMERIYPLQRHLWRIQSANLWHVALPTLVSMSRPHVTTLMHFVEPLLECPFLQCLPIPYRSMALLL